MSRKLCIVFALAASLASGCAAPSWWPSYLRPYRPDVQQGNIIIKDMVDQLKPGMTRDQVRFLLGTPMLTDIFHQERWDYPYVLKRARGSEMQVRKLHVIFADGKLVRYESDPMPTEPLADNLILGKKNRADAVATPSAPSGSPSPAAPPESKPAGPDGKAGNFF